MAGMTQTEFAKRMGMSQQTFSSRLKVGKFTQEELEKWLVLWVRNGKADFIFTMEIGLNRKDCTGLCIVLFDT